jgi:hypothetical protein
MHRYVRPEARRAGCVQTERQPAVGRYLVTDQEYTLGPNSERSRYVGIRCCGRCLATRYDVASREVVGTRSFMLVRPADVGHACLLS